MKEALETEFVTLDDVLELHREMIDTISGSHGIKDIGGVESAVAQPQMTFGGEDIYPTLVDKAAALGFSLVKNHAFTDGNKLVGTIDEHERIILKLAASELGREEFTAWVHAHVMPVEE